MDIRCLEKCRKLLVKASKHGRKIQTSNNSNNTNQARRSTLDSLKSQLYSLLSSSSSSDELSFCDSTRRRRRQGICGIQPHDNNNPTRCHSFIFHPHTLSSFGHVGCSAARVGIFLLFCDLYIHISKSGGGSRRGSPTLYFVAV
jgi:hypothetical protein